MITVDVYIPAMDRIYNFNLDEESPIQVLVEEISELICKKEHSSLDGERAFLPGRRQSRVRHGVCGPGHQFPARRIPARLQREKRRKTDFGLSYLHFVRNSCILSGFAAGQLPEVYTETIERRCR